jgi:hypothetical protein
MARTQADFQTRQGEVTAKLEETRGKIEELEAMPYLTDQQRGELAELIERQGDLQGEYDANAEAHDKATKRILLGILEQRLAQEGWTAESKAQFEKQAREWGLWSDSGVKAVNDVDIALEFHKRNLGDISTAMDIILSKPDHTWTLTEVINTIRTETIRSGDSVSAAAAAGREASAGGVGIARAHGGPVWGGQSYLVGERGPEMFIPHASGYVMSNADSLGLLRDIANNTADGRPPINIYVTAPNGDDIGASVSRELRLQELLK